jgi:glutamyl-tRNA reductase
MGSVRNLVMVGVSHHRAPLALRERVAVDQADWDAAEPKAPGAILLSTCNRLEVYAWADARPAAAVQVLRRRLACASGVDLATLSSRTWSYAAVTTHSSISCAWPAASIRW